MTVATPSSSARENHHKTKIRNLLSFPFSFMVFLCDTLRPLRSEKDFGHLTAEKTEDRRGRQNREADSTQKSRGLPPSPWPFPCDTVRPLPFFLTQNGLPALTYAGASINPAAASSPKPSNCPWMTSARCKADRILGKIFRAPMVFGNGEV